MACDRFRAVMVYLSTDFQPILILKLIGTYNLYMYYNNLIFFMFIRFPAILLVKTIDSYLHEFCARGILHSDFQ